MRNYLFLLVLLSPGVALGQGMSDPTRPPFSVGEGVGEGDGSAKADKPVAQRKGLLSVILSVERCAANIDGKMFSLGEKYGDAILVEIKPQSVVLMGKQGRRSLELFPGVGVKITAEQTPMQKSVSCKLNNQEYENQEDTKNSLRPAVLKEKK